MKTVRLRGVLAVVGLIITVVGCNGGTDPVIDPIVDPIDPVELEIRMTVSVQGPGLCGITGPMWHEPGTSSFLLQGQTATLPLGTRSPGEIVDVTQTFTGGCTFFATLWADQTVMVSDFCSTGAANECVINLQGVVP